MFIKVLTYNKALKNLACKHLDRKLSKLDLDEIMTRPARGWIRAVHEALGLTTTQLAKRLGVRQPSIIDMEKAEQRNAISLETLQRAAAAMNCRLAPFRAKDNSHTGLVFYT